MKLAAPLTHYYDLGDLSQAGAEVVVAASGEELSRLAQWAGVEAVESFRVAFDLRKLSRTRFVFEGELAADVVQACVVTLEPVRSHIARHFSRALHLIKSTRPMREDISEIAVAVADEEGPEEIDSPHYDLAAAALEELVLAIDPYPRAPDVAFEPPKDAAAPESPFAVLKTLKGKA